MKLNITKNNYRCVLFQIINAVLVGFISPVSEDGTYNNYNDVFHPIFFSLVLLSR